MTAPASLPRIAAVRVRLAVLAALAAGHLPVPVVHTHAALAAAGSSRLARHVALFHAGAATDATRPHMHLVPPVFFAGGGLGDATGEDVPDPCMREASLVTSGQLDAPFAPSQADAVREVASPVARWVARPRQFLATFSEGRDLGGLLGVCLC